MYTFDDIYYTLIGQRCLESSVPGVANAFANGGLCDREWEKAYEARLRIYGRLGCEEDDDMIAILDSVDAIQKELCRRMLLLGIRCKDGLPLDADFREAGWLPSI